MAKYEITFKFDIEEILNYDEDEQAVEIDFFDDDCFHEAFDTNEKIKELEEYLNDIQIENENIVINDIYYNGEDEDLGVVIVDLKDKLQNPEKFANEIVSYLFDGECPMVKYHVEGTTSEPYWDHIHSTSRERGIKVSYDDSGTVKDYYKVKIKEI